MFVQLQCTSSRDKDVACLFRGIPGYFMFHSIIYCSRLESDGKTFDRNHFKRLRLPEIDPSNPSNPSPAASANEIDNETTGLVS